MRMYKYSDVLMSIVAQHFLIFINIILSIINIKLMKENLKRIGKMIFYLFFYIFIIIFLKLLNFKLIINIII